MGTRGLYGIRKDGVDKCTYNHFDSYPDYLGKEVLEFCATNSIEGLSRLFDNIEIVYEGKAPTKEQIDTCKKLGYANFGVSDGNEANWYCLLRNLQGNFKAYTDCINNDNKMFMIDYIDFIKDSLFCEYAYIINIDDGVLEFYNGFQHTPQADNRYGTECDDDGYYPCRLSLVIPLDYINSDNIDELVDKMNKVSNEDEEDVE